MLTSVLTNYRYWAIAMIGAIGISSPALAGSPGIDAIEEFRSNKNDKSAVENRFFLKEGRFEIAPMVGYVPNNPFARRYVVGGILGYHFSEALSAQVQIGYSPDGGEGDLKPLVGQLLEVANAGPGDGGTGGTGTAAGQVAFQQPLDKIGLFAAFGVAWAPLYGKINLVGETVLNFDFYLFGGAGMVSKNNYNATYDIANAAVGDVVNLAPLGNEVKVAPYVGMGQNYFLSQTFAVKLDVRAAFYVDGVPQYNPNENVPGQRLYNNLVAGVGVSMFLPKMKPRLYEF